MSATVTTTRTRRLVGGSLAAALAAATVSLVPSPASAADSSVLDVFSTDDDVTLSTAVTTVLQLLGSSTEYVFEDSEGRTWRLQDRRTSIGALLAPLTFDADRPTEAFDDVRFPAGLSEKLPDGAYDVTAVTTLKTLLGSIPLSSASVGTTIDRFTSPSAPRAVSLQEAGQQVVSWLAPAETGGTPITAYVVRLFGADGQIGDDVVLGPDALEYVLPSLPTQLTRVVVVARNAVDDSLPGSVAPTGTVFQPAGAPTARSAAHGDQSATVSWTAPATGPTPLMYAVTATPGGATCSTASTSCTVRGLDNGTPYTFTVSSLLPEGAASSPTALVVPSTVPGSTGPLSASSVGSDSATLRWTAPQSNGGSAVTGYVVTVAGRALETAGTELSLTGLTERTSYTAEVVAKNANGPGTTPATATFTTAATPPLKAAVWSRAKRSGSKAALVKVDLNRAGTVAVRVVRGKLVASRTVALGSAPTWVSVPVSTKARKLLDGKRVSLQVLATNPTATLASKSGTVRR